MVVGRLDDRIDIQAALYGKMGLQHVTVWFAHNKTTVRFHVSVERIG